MGIKRRPRATGIRQTAEVSDPGNSYGILEYARQPIAVLAGPEQNVSYVNPALCRLACKTQEDIVGKPFAELLPAGDECLLHLERVYRTGRTESHTEHEDARPHPFYWSYEIWPIVEDATNEGSPTGVVILITQTGPLNRRAIAMNEALLISAMHQQELMEAANTHLQAEIKERKHAEGALLRSQMLANAGRMAASIAHEINNPLEAVMNTLYLARTTTAGDAIHDYLDIADGELKRIAHITRQTLGFYRESSAPTSILVASLMASVIDLLQAKIKSTGATIQQQCDEGLSVTGVAGELRQVLANLLANSLDAVERKHGLIKLRGSMVHCGDRLHCTRITVADNGTGIDAATRQHIFEPFFTTKGVVGTGLGLWVCKELVDKNGGSIWVRSNTSGERRGTTFSVLFPASLGVDEV